MTKIRRPITESHIIKRADHDAVLDYLWTYLPKKKRKKVLVAINENRHEENEERRLSRIKRLRKRIAKDTRTLDGLLEASSAQSEQDKNIVDYERGKEYPVGAIVRHNGKLSTVTPDDGPNSDGRSCSACTMYGECGITLDEYACGHTARSDNTSVHYRETA